MALGGRSVMGLRYGMACVATALGALVLTGTAQAAEPAIFQLPGTNTAGSSGFCSFPVTVVLTSDQKTRPGPVGVTTGHGTATVRNDVTGKTLRYNVSGPGKIVSNSDGSFSVDAGGPNLLWTTVANSAPGVPQIAYSTGHLQFAVDASGKTTSYSFAGKRTDVCAALS